MSQWSKKKLFGNLSVHISPSSALTAGLGKPILSVSTLEPGHLLGGCMPIEGLISEFVFRLQTRSQPLGPGSSCGSRTLEILGKSDFARHSDEIHKRRKAQEVRVPDPMTHNSGFGLDFSEASTPGV